MFLKAPRKIKNLFLSLLSNLYRMKVAGKLCRLVLHCAVLETRFCNESVPSLNTGNS